ncbi:agamous-like MADS-box protein AGL27 isoform X1 [Brassica napus]|uniref:agamous-like MADS-box protein AGL27 isoform X1 n=1 Tax=Brassica napus TaxID=3708 RepID=UPI002078952F|nr:agamous-like MADS-box protein AGL27 isoform X1 [Brassica napus]
MGRRKVEIKLIENKSSRQVTFSKRRTGLIEKARQLSVLCESSVAVLVVSASGKLYNSSSGDNMTNIIDRYGIQHACELRSLDLAENTRSYLPHNELLESVKSNLEESNVDNVSVDSLISLEDQLETALSATRARKTELTMEFVKMLQEKEGLLREENLVLTSQR